MIKVRRVLYTKKGFQAGEYLGEYYTGDMAKAFDYYTKLWMELYTDEEGEIIETVPEENVNYIEEFTISDPSHSFIGLPETICFEIIDDELYELPPFSEMDEYGFEQMKDVKGNNIPYSNKDGGNSFKLLSGPKRTK